MTQMMDLNKMGVIEINSVDLASTNGGLWYALLRFTFELIENRKDIIAGVASFVEGASAGSQQNGGIFYK